MHSNISLNLPVHPRLRHPLTGEPIQALGRRADGRLIWPIMGGAPDGADGGDGGSSGDAGQTGGQAGGNAGQGGDQGAGGTGGQQTGGDAGQGDQQTGQSGAWDGKVESLPEPVQKMIRDLRKEAGDNRVGKTAAEEQQQKILKAVAKAAGLKVDDEEDTPDAAKLTEQLTTTQQQARDAAVELAVFKAAGPAGADPIGLTDSRTFMTKVGKLDPTADDFAAKVKAEIETATKDNPKLKAGRAPGASSVDHAGGTGDQTRRTSSKPLSIDQAVSGHYQTA